jgi:nucleoside-diphosphate-sugar epimerase
MAVLITGATGFVGSELALRFVKEGYEVLATDFNEPSDDIRARWGSRVEYVKSNISDHEVIAEMVRRSGPKDPVIHMAGILTAGCDRDPALAMEVNVKGFANVLVPAARTPGRVVVLASTIGVYGRGLPQPITEDMPLEPDGWYGLTKATGEQMGLLENRRHGVDFRAVRLAAVTGPGRKAGSGSASLFSSFIPEKGALGEKYEIEVTPDTVYPVVYIKDAVDAVFTLATAAAAPSRIYNISSGRIYVDKMVEAVRKRFPDSKLSYKPVDDIMAVVSGYKEWEISVERARRELGWSPTYTVDAMMEDIFTSVLSRS